MINPLHNMIEKSTNSEFLLVEDDAHDADRTIRVLQKSNFPNRVHWLQDGKTAEKILLGQEERGNGADMVNPRLILLDLNMSKTSGIDLLRVIKSNERLNTTPVVVLTSSLEDQDLEECYALGINSCMVKPVNHDDFFEVAKDIGLHRVLLNETVA